MTLRMPAALWPWLTLAGQGFFHGINPAMGWLFEFWRPLLSFEPRERCRLLARSRHPDRVGGCPLSGVKRTSQFDRAMSAFDPKRTFAA
jgi:hypothetical protein